jgi:MarR family transcriptional regulator, lower aerobic nicotinate degradation pathway regulator
MISILIICSHSIYPSALRWCLLVAHNSVMPSFDFSQAPGHLIRRAHQTSIALFAQEMLAFDVTAVQFAIMQALLDNPGADQITVAQQVALDAATSGSVISRLEARGWLRREADTADKRRKLMWLTAEGRKAANQMKKPVQKVQDQLLAALNAQEQAQLVGLLKKINAIE